MAHTKETLLAELKLYNGYFHWLLETVMYHEMRDSGRSYLYLLQAMRAKTFTWTIPNDENRANDGKNLRIKYGNLVGRDGTELKGACNFLEMCIALATRINDDIFEHDPGSKPARWFWIMMENCGLDKYTDEKFDEIEVNKIMDRVILRRYSKTGKGGFFPIKDPKRDQREIELWYQMQNYIIENFDC